MTVIGVITVLQASASADSLGSGRRSKRAQAERSALIMHFLQAMESFVSIGTSAERSSGEQLHYLYVWTISTMVFMQCRWIRKGVAESSLSWLTAKVTEAGSFGIKIVIGSDQEEALVALKKAVGIRRQAETEYIESPSRDLQSNAHAKRSVRTWAAPVRTR